MTSHPLNISSPPSCSVKTNLGETRCHMNYVESLSGSAKEIYKLKLATAMFGHGSYKYPAGQWLHDMTKWPEVTCPDVSGSTLCRFRRGSLIIPLFQQV